MATNGNTKRQKQKLLMLSGLAASGKSTHAEMLVLGGGNWVRVNKDLIRTMLHFEKWSGKNEDITIKAEKAIAKAMLEDGRNVVVDDTNMSTRHKASWMSVASETGSAFDMKVFDTDIDTCIQRDKYREKPVGEHVIKQMAMQYGLVEFPNKLVICDIDGTIADITHRLHFVKGEGKKDWKGFFSCMDQDAVRDEVHGILKELHKQGVTIVFVSARPEDYRDVTEKWLTHHVDVPWFTLIMRRANDTREDSLVKKQILDTYFRKDDIYSVIDDRPRVVAMWKENGLDVIDVGPKDENGNPIDF